MKTVTTPNVDCPLSLFTTFTVSTPAGLAVGEHGSTMQSAGQPSALTVFPSSQVSGDSIMPFPQTGPPGMVVVVVGGVTTEHPPGAGASLRFTSPGSFLMSVPPNSAQ